MQDLLDNGYKLKIIKEPLYYLNMKGNISVTHKEEQQYFANCKKTYDPKRYIMIQIKDLCRKYSDSSTYLYLKKKFQLKLLYIFMI